MSANPSRLLAVALTTALLATVTVAAPAAAQPKAGEDEFVLVFPQPEGEVRFSDDWGNARSGGRSHKGTDLLAEKMDPVVAVADGVVERIKTSGLAGRYLMIRHENGYDSYYMHLNNDTPGTDDGRADLSFTFAPGIEEGAVVEAGQLIAWVGDSGNAEGSTAHTHFELHKDGEAINPYPFLAAAWERHLIEVAIEEGEVAYK